jgi:hypothetical protein
VPTLESQDFLKGWKQFTLELEKISHVFVAHLHLISIRSTYSIRFDSKCRGKSFWSTLTSSFTLIQDMHESNCLPASRFSLTFDSVTHVVGKRTQPWETARMLIFKGASDALIDDVTVIKYFSGPRPMSNFLQQHMYPSYREFPHRNVYSSQSYVSREQRRLGSGSAQVCSPLLRDAAQLRITSLEIINF